MRDHNSNEARKDKPQRRRPNRTGSVRKVAGGWQARYREPAEHGGQQRSKTFRRKTDAEGWLRKQYAEMDAGSWQNPRRGRTLYRVLVVEWRESWADLKPSTQNRYDGILRNHLLPEFGARPLSAITQRRVQRFVNRLGQSGLKPGTVAQVMAVLGSSLAYAVECDHLAAFPFKAGKRGGVKLPKHVKREPLILTAEQVATLAEAMPPRYRVFPFFAAYTGLRFSEMAGLKIGRLDLMRGYADVRETLTVVNGQLVWDTPKSHKPRKLSLPRFLVEMMAEHIRVFVDDPTDRDALVFTTDKGRPIKSTNFGLFKRAVKAGLPEHLHELRPHDLRHTHASLLIEQGVHPKAIQERLGHANIGITMDTYGHLLPGVDDRLTAGLEETFRQMKEQPDEPGAEEQAE